MKRLNIPRRVRTSLIWAAVFAVALGLRFELGYRDDLGHLPSLVDSAGSTASVEIAMSALDSYDRINHERKLGFASFGLALLLGVSVVVTRELPKTDAS